MKATLRTLTLIIAALVALWILLVNALLVAGGLDARLNRLPERLKLTWSSAWSPLPGLLIFHDLAIRTQSDTLQMELRVDGGRLWIQPLALLSHEVQIVAAQGHGVRVRARHRLAEDTGGDIIGGPAIAGLSNPPQPDPEVIYPPPDPPTLSLKNVTLTEVLEVWVDGFRFEGRADIEGDLTLLPRSWVEVGTVGVEIHHGAAHLGDQPMLGELRGRLQAHFERVALGGDEPSEALSQISGQLELGGEVASLSFINTYLRGAPWLRVDGTPGPFEAKILLTDGELAMGSELSVTPAELEAHVNTYTVRGPGSARWEVEAGTMPLCTLSMTLDDYTVWRGASRLVVGDRFTVTAQSAELALADAFANLRVELEMPSARLPDLRALGVYLPHGSGAELVGGSGTAAAHFSASTEDAGGGGYVEINASGAAMTVGALGVKGDGHLRLNLEMPDVKLGRFVVDGSRLELREVKLETDGEAHGGDDAHGAPGWWSNVEVTHGALNVGEAIFLRADLVAELEDSGPVVAVFATQRDLPRWVQGILTREKMIASTRIAVGDGYLRLDPFKVSGEGVDVEARLVRRGKANQGSLLIGAGNAHVGVGLRGSDREVKLLGAEAWFRARPVLGEP